MKKLIVYISLFIPLYVQATYMSWFKSLITHKPPGQPVDEKTNNQCKELLKALNHKNPDAVCIRWYSPDTQKNYTKGYYSRALNTIFLDKTAGTFTKAHEAAHATHHTNIGLDILPCIACYAIIEIFRFKRTSHMSLRKTILSCGGSFLLNFNIIKKIYVQPRELQADIEATKALLKLDDQKAIQESLEKLIFIPEEIKTLSNKTTSEKILRYVAQKYSGFYFDPNQKQLVIDRKKGTSEKFLTNWSTHPTDGKRYFEIKKIVDQHNQSKR